MNWYGVEQRTTEITTKDALEGETTFLTWLFWGSITDLSKYITPLVSTIMDGNNTYIQHLNYVLKDNKIFWEEFNNLRQLVLNILLEESEKYPDIPWLYITPISENTFNFNVNENEWLNEEWITFFIKNYLLSESWKDISYYNNYIQKAFSPSYHIIIEDEIIQKALELKEDWINELARNISDHIARINWKINTCKVHINIFNKKIDRNKGLDIAYVTHSRKYFETSLNNISIWFEYLLKVQDISNDDIYKIHNELTDKYNIEIENNNPFTELIKTSKREWNMNLLLQNKIIT